MAGFPKFSRVDWCVPGAYGVHCASGSSSVAPSVHNGSAIWLSSLFSERFSESGRSKLSSGGCTVAREMAKAHVHYQVLLNEKSAAAMPTSLKVTSGASGFKVMGLFDWSKDKAIYQRWQLWSEKARHTLGAMEGDSEKSKISYFHHWIDGEEIGHIESWKNNKILFHVHRQISIVTIIYFRNFAMAEIRVIVGKILNRYEFLF